MMGLGFTEIIVIAGIALVVIGPEKFPDFAKLVIRTIRDLRSYVDEVKLEVGKELKPLKKEMDALSRIDPEKYIDSLTAEAKPPKPVTSPNMPVSPEDQKILAEAARYGEDGELSVSDESVEESTDGVPEATPERTVGYGTAESVDETVETTEPVASENGEEDEFEALRDPIGTDSSGEPDVWTGR